MIEFNFERIGLIDAIDGTVPNQKGEQQVVSCGEATQAVVLNALGLTGRALDDLQQGGVTEMFATIASHALKAYGIEPEYAHVDSSSISLKGEYESAYASA